MFSAMASKPLIPSLLSSASRLSRTAWQKITPVDKDVYSLSGGVTLVSCSFTRRRFSRALSFMRCCLVRNVENYPDVLQNRAFFSLVLFPTIQFCWTNLCHFRLCHNLSLESSLDRQIQSWTFLPSINLGF
uniref:Uncharacterized protein n=1 Tax=Proboscia inermis TaxID=420281 RepID=A0A7S0CLE6_9STRA